MRVFFCVISVLSLVVIPAGHARAAMQFTLWPAQFSYGTPPGDFAWNSTMFGFRFDEPLGPFVSLRTDLRYGSVANLSFSGNGLSGYSGGTWIADSALRVGLRTGPVGFAAYGGYGGLFVNATGPSSDYVVLRNLSNRLGVEATVATSRGLMLRGSYAWITGLSANADFSLTAPAVAASRSGSGSGSEYEIMLQYSPVPLTNVFAGYRGGSSQISWSGGGTTSSSFQGYLVGVELRF